MEVEKGKLPSPDRAPQSRNAIAEAMELLQRSVDAERSDDDSTSDNRPHANA